MAACGGVEHTEGFFRLAEVQVGVGHGLQGPHPVERFFAGDVMEQRVVEGQRAGVVALVEVVASQAVEGLAQAFLSRQASGCGEGFVQAGLFLLGQFVFAEHVAQLVVHPEAELRLLVHAAAVCFGFEESVGRAQPVVLCALDVPFEDVEVGNAQGVPREEVIVADGQLAQRVGFGQPSFFVETLALYLPAQGTAFVGEPPSLQGLQPCGA